MLYSIVVKSKHGNGFWLELHRGREIVASTDRHFRTIEAAKKYAASIGFPVK